MRKISRELDSSTTLRPVRRLVGRIGIRVVDQIFWSVAFYVLNVWSAFSLSTDVYASLAVGSSVGLIATACARAYGVDGRLVHFARRDRGPDSWWNMSVALRSSFFWGFAGVVVTGALLWLVHPGTVNVGVVGLALVMVIADVPHYMLVMRKKSYPAAALSLFYMLFAAGFALTKSGDPLWVWLVACVVVGVPGWLVVRSQPPPFPRLRSSARTTSVRLSAEALYSALASQAGLIAVYMANDATSAVGLRLAYSLVFAPVFFGVQALTPLLVNYVSMNLRRPQHIRRMAAVWALFWAFVALAFGMGSSWVGEGQFSFSSRLALASPFVLCVGLSLVSGIVLESGVLLWRFYVSPVKPHRLRIAVVGVDLGLQFGLVWLHGASGLVEALAIGGIIKCVLGLVLLLRIDGVSGRAGIR